MEKFELKSEKATDMELAAELIKHINAPCEDLHGNNLRDFYIRESKKSLESMTDPDAIKMLKSVIEAYVNDEF